MRGVGGGRVWVDLGCGRLRRGARGEGRGARGEGGLCEASGSLGPERATERTGRATRPARAAPRTFGGVDGACIRQSQTPIIFYERCGVDAR